MIESPRVARLNEVESELVAAALAVLLCIAIAYLSGCATPGTWHHSTNTPREVAKDMAECAVQDAQAQLVLPNVFGLCMVGRGYEWREGPQMRIDGMPHGGYVAGR